MNPLVSAVIPTYNRASTICRAVDSILQQTYSSIEVIVVDDGSKDSTLEVLSAYGSRIRVVAQENKGPAIARNRGIEAAHGSIVAFLDSDDIWLPTKIEKQVALMEKAHPSFPCCLCNARLHLGAGVTTSSFSYALLSPAHPEGLWLNVSEILATRFIMFIQMAAIRRTALEKIGGFDESITYLEDYDLPLRLSFQGPWTYLAEPLVDYAEGSPESWSKQAHSDKKRLLEFKAKILRRAVEETRNREDLGKTCRLLTQSLRSTLRLMQATDLLASGAMGKILLGHLIEKFDHYQGAFVRRAGFLPQMDVRPLT